MELYNGRYMEKKTSKHMVGKVMSLSVSSLALGMFLGNFLYGFLFNHHIQSPHIALFIVAAATIVVAFFAKIDEKKEPKNYNY